MEANKYFQTSFPCKISSDSVKGRVLLATRDILPGELAFEEQPLVFGPSFSKNDEPSCLNCLRVIKRGLWSCSTKCKLHFEKTSEYVLIQNYLARCQDWKIFFEVLLILRCLALKQTNSDQWTLMTDLDPHHQELTKDQDFISMEDKIIDVIRSSLEQTQYDEDDIRLLHRVLYINALEYHPHADESSAGKALFPITSFASHDCLNNTFRTRIWKKNESEEPFIQTRAKIAIHAGEEITLHYSGGLKGRLERRKILLDGWCFACQCSRCTSPSEMGSHFSSLKCTTRPNCRGNLLPNIDPNIAGLNDVLHYECDHCHEKVKCTIIQSLEKELSQAIESTYSDDIEALETVLDEFGFQFHPQHYLLCIVKWLLINLLGRKPGFANGQLSRARLDAKIQFCQDYLNALDVIDPGISHNRGRTLWEMYSAQVFRSQLDFQNQTITKKEFQESLANMRQMLEEVQKCMYFSDEGSFEAKIVQLSQKALISINELNSFLEIVP